MLRIPRQGLLASTTLAFFLATHCVAQETSPELAAADESSRRSPENQVSADEDQSSKSIPVLHQKEVLAKQPQIVRPKLIERPQLMPVEKKRIEATRRAPIHEQTDALRNAAQELGPDHPKVASLRQQIQAEQRASNESQVRLRKELLELEEEMQRTSRMISTEDDDNRRRLIVEKLQFLEHRPDELRQQLNHSGQPERIHAEGDKRADHRHRERELDQVNALHEAAERLDHSGLSEMARELRSRAEAMEREINGQQRGSPEHVIHELMQNLDQLRGEVRELNRKMDDVLKRLDRRER